MEVTEELQEHISSQKFVLGVRGFGDTSFNKDAVFEIAIAWQGL